MMMGSERLDEVGDHAGASQVMEDIRSTGLTGYYGGHTLGSILFNHLVYGVDTMLVPDRNDPLL